jgi:multidrug efflux pump
LAAARCLPCASSSIRSALFKYGIGLEDVRAALAAANANSPKGALQEDGRRFQLYTNDQAKHAADYQNLIVAYRDNAPVRLSDVAGVSDSVEDLRNQGLFNGSPSVVLILFRQPGANIIDTVDRVKRAPAAITGFDTARHRHPFGRHGPHHDDPRLSA